MDRSRGNCSLDVESSGPWVEDMAVRSTLRPSRHARIGGDPVYCAIQHSTLYLLLFYASSSATLRMYTPDPT